ncbi:zinc finger protein 528-like [Ruditapes philippinarum]|uniref:zinc finger protein 528-like n=1 Tax=Ruditapes philippinarum TaxID=129788 RepID=UPI00295AC2AE|nr:zinc finger protein 528-like [Ruditapes philippinarum]
MEETAVRLVKQEPYDEDEGLYPFVCGICGYRFNRIKEYCKHFDLHSDMVTAEFFHSCTNGDDEEEDNEDTAVLEDQYDHSAKFYSCGVCKQQFATLCLMHDHFCENYSSAELYIVDPEKRQGLPRRRRCAGSLFRGSVALPEFGEVVKTEVIEDDGDDDMECENINDEDMEESLGDASEGADTPSKSRDSIGDKSESSIAIQKITVNYGDHSETYEIGLNGKKSEKKSIRTVNVKKKNAVMNKAATESEADEDMSDEFDKGIDSESSIKNKIKIFTKRKGESRAVEENMFESYENAESLRGRRRESVPVPASQIKDMIAQAQIVGEEEGSNTKSSCPVCQKTVLRSYLYQHFKKTHSDEEFPCHVCGKIFSNKGYRTDHIRFFHEGIKKIRNDGGLGFKVGRHVKAESRAILEKAVLVGEEDGNNTKVECPVCKKVLLRHYLVKHHQKLHSDKKYPCDQCDKVFPYNGYLADHKRYVHQGKKKKSQLTRYAKEADIIALCDSAQPVARKRGEKPKVVCPKCDKTIQQEYLAKHLRAAHSDEQYPCDICKKTYSCKRFLYEHQKYVHMEKDTECEICQKLFKGFAAKEKHKRLIHTDNKPFQCEKCGSAFRTSFECKRHMSQHEDINLFPYQCPKCERRFKSQKSMLSHERSVHRRVGRLQCKWPGCNRILNDKATFRKHYCIHTGEKPNKCPVCDKGFIQRVALKYHLKTKHNSEEKMPPGRSPACGDNRVKHPDIQLFREAQPVPLDPDEYVEEYTEVPMESLVQGTEVQQVNLSDASIVSDLIEIAQSSEGGTVPAALQHVFDGVDGENRTIVIYYQ